MAKNFKSWPEHWPRHLDYPDIPVFEMLEQTVRRSPDRVAIIFGGMELTFLELKTLVDRMAVGLAKLGLGKDRRFAIHLPNCPQFAIAYYAGLKTGATFTPLSPLLSPGEAKHQLADSGARVLVSLDLIFGGVKDVLGETDVEHVITTSIADCYNPIIQPLKPLGKIPVPDTLDMAEMLRDNEGEPEAPDIDPNRDIAHLAYTGGTTGVSKGVMLTHKNVIANCLQFSSWFSGTYPEWNGETIVPRHPEGLDPEDSVVRQDSETALVVVPWFHAMGTIGYLNNMVGSGSTMVVFPRFDPHEYLTAVGKYRATSMGGAPQLYVPLCSMPDFGQYDLSSIKIAASGAAPLPVSILNRMQDSMSGVVMEAYGATECTMGALANPPRRNLVRPGSVGLPLADTEVAILDPATDEEVPVGTEGEICIRGPQVMLGYWNRPEATAEVLRDGWLHTGDVGRVDEDGYFYITDRMKDMIIYKGYNVYPRELEEVLHTHPAVENCAVVGKPDEKGGEIPVGFVQLRPGREASAEELIEHVNKEVAAYKKLRDLQFVDAIPVSQAGKILKRELREKLKQEQPA
ncbi:MAG: class I adenylate-forming enzyme family protein [Desulfatibacillaceae bacterium]